MYDYKFKKGDIVVCVKRERGEPMKVGELGVVLEDDDTPYILWNKCRMKFPVYEDQIELVEDLKKK